LAALLFETTALLLFAHTLEFLRALFHRHELAQCFVALRLGRLAHHRSLSLCPLLHSTLARVVANRLINRHRYLSHCPPLNVAALLELGSWQKSSAPERIGRLKLESTFCFAWRFV
jgi:hypothetical protein